MWLIKSRIRFVEAFANAGAVPIAINFSAQFPYGRLWSPKAGVARSNRVRRARPLPPFSPFNWPAISPGLLVAQGAPRGQPKARFLAGPRGFTSLSEQTTAPE